MTLLGTALAWLASPYWLILTAIVGINLSILSMTGFCPAAIVMHRAGLKSGIDGQGSCLAAISEPVESIDARR